jgi:hypothetical protein
VRRAEDFLERPREHGRVRALRRWNRGNVVPGEPKRKPALGPCWRRDPTTNTPLALSRGASPSKNRYPRPGASASSHSTRRRLVDRAFVHPRAYPERPTTSARANSCCRSSARGCPLGSAKRQCGAGSRRGILVRARARSTDRVVDRSGRRGPPRERLRGPTGRAAPRRRAEPARLRRPLQSVVRGARPMSLRNGGLSR